MEKIKGCNDFTFWGCEDSDFFEYDWDLSELDADEQLYAQIPLKIANISKNMDDVKVSQRKVPLSSNLNLNADEESIIFINKSIKANCFKPQKLIKKNLTSSTVANVRIPLKQEISSLLRAWASVKKNGGTFKFGLEAIEADKVDKLKSGCTKSQIVIEANEDFVTMKCIPAIH